MDVVDVGLAGDAAHRGPQRRQPMTSEELDLKSVTSSVKHLPDPSSFFPQVSNLETPEVKIALVDFPALINQLASPNFVSS